MQDNSEKMTVVDFNEVQILSDRAMASLGKLPAALILDRRDYSVKVSESLSQFMVAQRFEYYRLLVNDDYTEFAFQMTDDVTAEKWPVDGEAFAQVKLWDLLTITERFEDGARFAVLPVVKDYVGGRWGKRLVLKCK